jgi:predicted MFS family arabinose efflux permease
MAKDKVYRNRNFQIVCSAGLMMMMGVSIIVPAFPRMAESLGVTEQSIGLLITASTLPSFILTPLAGVMADRLGRKRLLVPSLFLFGIFGVSCAFAPDFKILIVLRVLQGIAGAPMGGVTGAIIGDLFSGQKRAEAMGLNTTIMYVGYIIYPLIGGALADLAWNYTFLPFGLTVPLGFLALAFLRCPEPESEQSLRDYLGEALHYLKSLKVLWLFSASVLTYVLLYGAYLTYFSLLLGGRFQASSFTIGMFISAVGLVTAVAASQVGRLSKRLSVASLITGAFVIYAFAMAIIPASPNLWLCLLPTLIFGIAHGLNLPSQQVIAAGVAPLEHRAGFMAISGTMIFLGMTIGPPIMGLVFSLANLNITFLAAAVIALIIPVMAIIIGRGKLSAT